jgi:hypothetical protein
VTRRRVERHRAATVAEPAHRSLDVTATDVEAAHLSKATALGRQPFPHPPDGIRGFRDAVKGCVTERSHRPIVHVLCLTFANLRQGSGRGSGDLMHIKRGDHAEPLRASKKSPPPRFKTLKGTTGSKEVARTHSGTSNPVSCAPQCIRVYPTSQLRSSYTRMLCYYQSSRTHVNATTGSKRRLACWEMLC